MDCGRLLERRKANKLALQLHNTVGLHNGCLIIAVALVSFDLVPRPLPTKFILVSAAPQNGKNAQCRITQSDNIGKHLPVLTLKNWVSSRGCGRNLG